MKPFRALLALCVMGTATLAAQAPAGRDDPAILLTPDRVFDGFTMHTDWSVLVRGDRILVAGPTATSAAPPDARRIALKGMTLIPGLIEGHSHLLLHPYNE